DDRTGSGKGVRKNGSRARRFRTTKAAGGALTAKQAPPARHRPGAGSARRGGRRLPAADRRPGRDSPVDDDLFQVSGFGLDSKSVNSRGTAASLPAFARGQGGWRGSPSVTGWITT